VWAAALVLLAVAAGAGIVWARRTPSDSLPEVLFDVTSPPTREVEAVALSPDGKTLAFAATFEGRTQLWLRPIDTALARPLAGTDGARMPFWSPDSRSVAFSAADGKLKRIDVDSGTVLTIPGVQGAAVGGAWNRDGVILFGTSPTPNNPLFRVADTGGEPVAIASTLWEAGRPIPDSFPTAVISSMPRTRAARRASFLVSSMGLTGDTWWTQPTGSMCLGLCSSFATVRCSCSPSIRRGWN